MIDDPINPTDPIDLHEFNLGADSVPRITWLLETHLGIRYEDALYRDLLYALELCRVGSDMNVIYFQYLVSKNAVADAAEAYADALATHRSLWGESL